MKATRPNILSGRTHKARCGCGSIYVTVNAVEGRPVEIFARLGKAGGCGSATMEAVGRAVSVGLCSGVEPRALAMSLRGIECHRSPSCVDALAQALLGEIDGALSTGREGG